MEPPVVGYALDLDDARSTWKWQYLFPLVPTWKVRNGQYLTYETAIEIAAERFGMPPAQHNEEAGHLTLILMTAAAHELQRIGAKQDVNRIGSEIVNVVVLDCGIDDINDYATILGLRAWLHPRRVKGWDDPTRTFEGFDELLKIAVIKEIGKRVTWNAFPEQKQKSTTTRSKKRKPETALADHLIERRARLTNGGGHGKIGA